MIRSVPLEAVAEAVCNASTVPPLIFELPPSEGRGVLENTHRTLRSVNARLLFLPAV